MPLLALNITQRSKMAIFRSKMVHNGPKIAKVKLLFAFHLKGIIKLYYWTQFHPLWTILSTSNQPIPHRAWQLPFPFVTLSYNSLKLKEDGANSTFYPATRPTNSSSRESLIVDNKFEKEYQRSYTLQERKTFTLYKKVLKIYVECSWF